MKSKLYIEETPPLPPPQKLPWTRLEKAIVIVALAVSVPALSFFLLRNYVLADELDTTQRQLAGSAALNLGRVYVPEHPDESSQLRTACANAFELKKPFRARFDTHSSDDSPLTQRHSASSGIVGTPGGDIYFVFLTGDDRHVTKVEIPYPIVLTDADGTKRISSSTDVDFPEPYD